MIRNPWIFAALQITLALLLFTGEAWAQTPPRIHKGEDPFASRARDAWVDSVDAEGVDLLVTARDLEEDGGPGRLAQALEYYLEAMERWGGRLCLVEAGEPYQRFLSIRRYCQLRIAAMPPTLLKSFRARMASRLKKAVREATLARDPETLARLAHAYVSAVEAPKALETAAAIFLEQGDVEWAEGLLIKLLSDHPAYAEAHPRVFGILAYALARLHRPQDLDDLRKRLSPKAAAWKLPGRDLTLGVLMDDLMRRLPLPRERWEHRPVDWNGLGGHPRGCLTLPALAAIDPHAQRADDVQQQAVEMQHSRVLRGRETQDPGTVFSPIFVSGSQGQVWLNGGMSCFGFSPFNGLKGYGWLGGQPQDTGSDDIISAVVLRNPRFFQPYYCATMVGSRLYRVENVYRVFGKVPSARRTPSVGFNNFLISQELSAGRNGRKSRGYFEQDKANPSNTVPPEPDPFIRKLHFHGSPTPCGSRLYIGATEAEADRQKKFNCYVLCFDRDLKEIWRRFVCSYTVPVNAAGPMIYEGAPPVVAEGKVFYNTNAGAVAALDAFTGELQWTVVYRTPLRRGDLRTARNTFWRVNPLVYHRGILYAAPQSTFRLCAIHPRSGRPCWQKPGETIPSLDVWSSMAIEWERQWKARTQGKEAKTSRGVELKADLRFRYVLGVSQGQVIVAADTQVHAVGRVSGRSADRGGMINWSSDFRSRLIGRGFVTTEAAYCPTEEGIEVFDLRDGHRRPGLAWSDVILPDGSRLEKVQRLGANLMLFRTPGNPGSCPEALPREDPMASVDGAVCGSMLIYPDVAETGKGVCLRCGMKHDVEVKTFLVMATNRRILFFPAALRIETQEDGRKEDH